jgi:HPt (histidine-containing phosphotransfer) domain-containing protein
MARVFDNRELLARVDNDWDLLAETVTMLATDGRALIEEIRRSLAKQDAPAVGRAAHTLKGMISNFCAASAQESALAVEKIGKSGDLTGAAETLRIADEQFEALVAALNEFITTRTR